MALLVEEWYTLCQEEIEMMREIRNLKSLRRGFLFAAAMFCAMGPHQDVYGAQRAPIQERRLEEDMEIGPGNPGPAADLASLTCTIDGNQIKIAGTVWGSEEELKRYDHYWYLFELAPYEDQLNGRTDYEAWWNRGDAISCALPLTDEDGSDRLYSRFVLAVYDGRTYRIVSKPAYITNPEALAGNKAEFMTPSTKKGLLLDGDMIQDALELGVKHISINIPFHQLFGEGITYEYEGKTYYFDKEVVESYDKIVGTMTRSRVAVTAILLNGWNDSTPQLFLPGLEKNPQALYYTFHGSTKEGAEMLEAAASFLAERYSGGSGSKGKIGSWIIGNEINNQIWNYAGDMELDQYVREYMKAFRIFYTAIKRVSSSDRLYISTDFNWMEPDASLTKYGARDVIDAFGAIIKEGGDIDWGLAYHPYADPLTEPEFWDDGDRGRTTDSAESRIVNFNNLHVLTDYMNRPELLGPSGKVRHIVLSEQGFTSQSPLRGDVSQIQAAALVYAYYIADSNPYIEAVLMNRQVDNVSEASEYVALGLWECDMTSSHPIIPTVRKPAWSVFQVMDRESSLKDMEFAKKIIGITKWSDVIPDFKWKSHENP